MSTDHVLEQLTHLSNAERLEVAEAAARLVRENLGAGTGDPETEEDRRVRSAAASVKDLYEPGGELTEWTALDAEAFVDDSLER
jgi:hypothetical protein